MKRALLFSLAIIATVAVIAGSQSKSANGSEPSAPQLIAVAKINDAGSLVRGFNIASVERLGDDANYGVKVTLTNVGSIDQPSKSKMRHRAVWRRLIHSVSSL
jgi:uncharacterized lipoprotein YbaY